MIFLLTWVIFRFHVNFQGCKRRNTKSAKLLRHIKAFGAAQWRQFPSAVGPAVHLNRGESQNNATREEEIYTPEN